MKTEIRNAIITAAKIDDAERGILSAWLTLDYGGMGQGFGGYCLFNPAAGVDQKNYAGLFIWRCMEIAGVFAWDKIPGKTIRVELRDGLIYKIGHIVKDDWFSPKEDFGNE